MATLVIDLRDKRPIWELPDSARQAIVAALPEGWTIKFMETLADASGDGIPNVTDELLEAVADARVYMGYGIPAEVLEAGARLEWVHSGAAGVATSLGPAMMSRDVLFTNSAGIHAVPMAETVIAMIHYFARGLDVAVRSQRAGRWGAPAYWAADAPVREIGASTVGVLGYGGIGREVAVRAAALGSSVLAVRRHQRSGPPTGDPAGVHVGAGAYILERAITGSDYLVLTLPETDDTRGILKRERIFSMKPGSVLINVARGRLVDEDALLDALGPGGPLRGAGLDVFHEEPLPAGHPFYSHPGVLMTPHVSATTRGFWARQTALITENLSRFTRGERLRNLVDKRAGY